MRIKLHRKFTFIFYFAAILPVLAGYFYFTPHLQSNLKKNIANNILKGFTAWIRAAAATWEGPG